MKESTKNQSIHVLQINHQRGHHVVCELVFALLVKMQMELASLNLT